MNFSTFLIFAIICGSAYSMSLQPGQSEIEAKLRLLKSKVAPNDSWNEWFFDYLLYPVTAAIPILKLDNIGLPNITNDFMPPETTIRWGYYDTHLRGIQKLIRTGPVTNEVEGPAHFFSGDVDVSLVDFRLSNKLDLDGFVVNSRYFGTAKHATLRITFKVWSVNLSIVIKEIRVVSLGDLKIVPWFEYGFERSNSAEGKALEILGEQLLKNNIPKIIENALSGENLLLFNSKLNELLHSQWNENKVAPMANHVDAFSFIYGARSEMCDTYQVDIEHTIEPVSREAPVFNMALSNGQVWGLDYMNRVSCPSRRCELRMCPRGDFTLKHDAVYLSFDAPTTYEGVTYNGSVYFTLTGLTEENLYECSLIEETDVDVYERNFVNKGEIRVDVRDVHYMLYPHFQEQLEQFGVQARDALLEQLSNSDIGRIGSSKPKDVNNPLCSTH